MYLKEIKLSGFKSFADKTSLEFSPDINVIVGPNGSGKSNIVDAVRWVLGEQSNKSLRADATGDIIFAGSKYRRALNSCSVCLIFDNTDHHLMIDFNEVSIKRVAFRSGENEYYLNNERCRLKDILELFMDSGSGKESFNVISQGKIDEILSVRPLERRIIFEEAAGVLKYKKRKEETLKKIEKTNQNLVRINDIINEVMISAEPLKIESDKAINYRNYQEELSSIEIALVTKDITCLCSENEELKVKNNILNDEIIALKNISISSATKIATIKQEIQKIDVDINNSQDLILNLTKDVESKDADIRVFEERNKGLKLDDNQKKVNFLNNEILKLSSKINKILGDIETHKEHSHEYLSKLDKFNNIYKTNLVNINKIKNESLNNSQLISDIEYKIKHIEEELNSSNYLPKAVRVVLNNPRFTAVHDVLSSVIEVSSEHVVAITTSLGSSSNNLIVSNKEEIKKIISYLRENNLGRITFYPLDDIKPRQMKKDVLDVLKDIPGFIDIASSLVKTDSLYENIIKRELGHVIVCDNIDTANFIATKTNHIYKIVTLLGDVINPGGTITGGSLAKITSSTSLKYEIDSLNNMLKFKLQLTKTLDDKYQKMIEDNNTVEYNIHDYNLSVSKHDSIISRLNSELNDLKNTKEKLEKELTNLNLFISSDDGLNNLYKDYYNLKDEIENETKKLEILKMKKKTLYNDMEETENDTNINYKNVSKLEKELSCNDIKLNRNDVKIDNLFSILTNDYNLTYDKAKENYHLDLEEDKARLLVKDLKSKISLLGDVNLNAPFLYQKQKERLDFLESQKNDLLAAEKTLFEITESLDKIMKDKFLTTFNQIKVEFKNVFKSLFRGGDADIYLTDVDNILESGIEIMAEPPGKRLQTISLLSGGEKTFTAISLLFAVLNVRPVPFCILDETEAALDEANVNNFGAYLNLYKNKTQFILITHKKKTMEFANVLYGITMKEAGVSSFVSVKLDDRRN